MQSAHGTLVAATVATVTVTADTDTVSAVLGDTTTTKVEVVNRSGAAEIYFTVDGTAPTVGGTASYVLPASICSYSVEGVHGSVVVKLISSGTPTYSVIGG